MGLLGEEGETGDDEEELGLGLEYTGLLEEAGGEVVDGGEHHFSLLEDQHDLECCFNSPHCCYASNDDDDESRKRRKSQDCNQNTRHTRDLSLISQQS